MKKYLSIILCSILVLTFFASCSKSNENAETTTNEATTISSVVGKYYDRNGKEYQSEEDVDYYTKDGTVYHYQMVEDYMPDYVNQETGEHLNGFYCYISEDGYFFYDENNTLSLVSGTIDTYSDKNGNLYYDISTVTWDSSGALVHN